MLCMRRARVKFVFYTLDKPNNRRTQIKNSSSKDSSCDVFFLRFSTPVLLWKATSYLYDKEKTVVCPLNANDNNIAAATVVFHSPLLSPNTKVYIHTHTLTHIFIYTRAQYISRRTGSGLCTVPAYWICYCVRWPRPLTMIRPINNNTTVTSVRTFDSFEFPACKLWINI